MKKLIVLRNRLMRMWYADDLLKYYLCCYAFIIIHAILTCFFYNLQVYALCVYNVFSVALYGYLVVHLIPKKKLFATLSLTVIEVLVHTVLCCYCIGWDYGFTLYALAVVPVIFYLFTTTPSFKSPQLYALFYTFLTIACFILTKIFLDGKTPVYELNHSATFVKVIFCLNCALAFLLQTIFSMLYTLEIQRFKENLENEKEALDAVASKDPLTGLLNRRAMEPHLALTKSLADAKGTPFCLILCDIDDFKKVNDIHGHALGDQVLKDISQTFLTNLRNTDFVCRWGGEEFLILIPGKKDVAIQIAEKLREKVSELTFVSEMYNFSVTMTFGISEYSPGYRVEKLIKIADDNLYVGKGNGKDQVVS